MRKHSIRTGNSLSVLRVEQTHKVRAELYVLKRVKMSMNWKKICVSEGKGNTCILRGIETHVMEFSNVSGKPKIL